MKKIFGALAVSASLLFGAQAFAAEEIVISGSTTVLPVVQKAGEAFMGNDPSTVLSISGSGSSHGIKALTEGLCHIAMSSRDMKESEMASAKAKGVDPRRFAIAHDAIVPVVNAKNPVASLTMAQLRDIYSGKTTNWKEVGGEDAPITVISRDTSSGTYESWGELVMNKERVTPRSLLQTSSGGVVTAVSQNENSIGYIGFGYLHPSLRALRVEGKSASPASVVAKEWPIARELYLFTNGEPSGAVKRFIEHMLDPQKGQKSVQEVGYVPL